MRLSSFRTFESDLAAEAQRLGVAYQDLLAIAAQAQQVAAQIRAISGKTVARAQATSAWVTLHQSFQALANQYNAAVAAYGQAKAGLINTVTGTGIPGFPTL